MSEPEVSMSSVAYALRPGMPWIRTGALSWREYVPLCTCGAYYKVALKSPGGGTLKRGTQALLSALMIRVWALLNSQTFYRVWCCCFVLLMLYCFGNSEQVWVGVAPRWSGRHAHIIRTNARTEAPFVDEDI